MSSSVLLLLHPLMASEPTTVEETKKKLQSLHPNEHLAQYVIDRVASGKQSLPESTFSLVYYLAPDGARKNKFNGPLAENIFKSLIPKGVFEGLIPDDCNVLAIKAGFLVAEDGTKWIKPSKQDAVVPLKRNTTSTAGKKFSGLPLFRKNVENITGTPNLTDSGSENLDDDNDSVETEMDTKLKESKLIYFENSDSDELTDEELYDENKLLDSPGISKPLVEPLKNCGRTGKKRRRACKNCTCGLKEEEESEDKQQRALQDELLSKMLQKTVKEAGKAEKQAKRQQQKTGKVVKFKPEEMNEIDFTVEGKKDGCGSCALGDAFRCDGCPYLGLPAFKPGQPISLEGMAQDI